MTTFTEGRHANEGLMSEAGFHRSRGKATIKRGSGIHKPGMVLGKTTTGPMPAAGAAGVPAPAAATITAAPTAAPGTKVGAHRFECIVGGAGALSKWRHTDPDGVFVGVATAGTAYEGGGLSALTITDAGTDPVAGEAFAVTVTSAAASLKYAPSPETETAGIEGAETAVAIALYGADATTDDAEISIIERDAEWSVNTLSYDASVDTAGKKATKLAQLAARGIIAR